MALFDSIQNLFPKQEKDTSIQGTQQDSVIQPLADEVKKAKLSPVTVDSIFKIVQGDPQTGRPGLMPGTVEFAKALGIESTQHGITPSAAFGPFGAIRDMFSPKAQDLARKQTLANKIGMLALDQMAELKRQQAQGPQSLQEAEQLLPGVIRPVESQRGATLDQIVGQGTQGPTQAVDPNASLTPAQQQLASVALENLGRGQLMASGNEIVPTSFAGMQGRRVPKAELELLQQVAIAPPGQIVPTDLPNVSPQVATSIGSLLGQLNRQAIQGPSVSNRLESLALVESAKRFGTPMRIAQVAQRDPELAEQLRQQADVQEARDIFSFQQNELLNLAAPKAARVKSAQLEVERDQPVDQPQLWRDPVTMKAASAQMTTRQAQSRNFVKLRPDQVETLNQMETIDKGLSEVKKIAEKVLSPKRKTALGEGWRALSQSARLAYLRATGDEDMLKMDSMITRLTAPLVKSQGDAANIAVAEREMFAQSLVNNRASTEAVLANLDNVIATTKSVRGMMGFTDKNEFESALVQSGMKSKDAADLAKKRFKAETEVDHREKIRQLLLTNPNMSDAEIKAALRK